MFIFIPYFKSIPSKSISILPFNFIYNDNTPVCVTPFLNGRTHKCMHIHTIVCAYTQMCVAKSCKNQILL